MHRLLAITAFALALAVPLWAQHGGGHGGGGGHAGGFSGGHAGGFSGGHSFSGGRVGGFSGHSGGFSSRSNAFSRSYGYSHSFNRNSSRSTSRIASRGAYSRNGITLRNYNYGIRGFRNFGYRSCFGYPCRNYGWGWGYPWWGYYGLWDWDHSDYDDDYANDRAMAEQMNQDSLDEQRMRRQEEADNDQDTYAPQRPANDKPTTPMFAPTVLVFRDQHKQEVSNYAVVGQTLWNFAPQKTERIPLSDLDLTATAQANEDRGINFRIPVQAR